METIKNFPNNADEYIGAEYVMKWLHGRTSGVFGADGNLAVSANDNMTVSVSDGVGWMANSKADGCVIWNDTEATGGSKLQLTVGLANSSLPRIDRVVVSWATVDYSAKPTIEILQGSPASQPQPPALTNTTLKRQISLAQIRVAAAASKITASDITDERMDETVCGLVTESVGVDTSVMQAQFEELLDTIQGLLGDLRGGTAFMLKSMYDTKKRGVDVYNYADDTAATHANAVSAKYEARLSLDGWVASTSEEQAAGYPLAQEVTLTAVTPGAPTVMAASEFLTGCGYDPTGVAATDEILDEVLAIVNAGVTRSLDGGKVRVIVKEKPAAEIVVNWIIRTEVG